MALRRRNPIRSYLKREKKTFATQISEILENKNDLTAREICTILYGFAEKKLEEKPVDVIVRQHITNITKDFNQQLCERLEKLNVERYFDEAKNSWRYKKIGQ